MTDPIPTMSETGTTWTRAKFLAEIADLPQLAKYVPPYGPMPGVPIADVVAMLREARAWRPIESAPHVPSANILLWGHGYPPDGSSSQNYAFTGFLAPQFDDWRPLFSYNQHIIITHWQPLPAAPNAS